MSTLHRLFLLGVALVSSWSLGSAADEPTLRPPSELDTLLGPIALHPDPLLAQILPASTLPTQIVLAARFVRANPARPDLIEAQGWDDSVKAVARVPSLLAWMDEHLEWTTQVGQSFIDQPDDVMDSVQRLRRKAYDLGNLQSGSQQTVVIDDTQIQILPANAQIVYVPVYQPEVIYIERARPDHFWLSFGIGFSVGAWFNHDCDWHRRRIIVWHRQHPRPIDYWHHRGPGRFDRHPTHHIDWRPRHDRPDRHFDRPHSAPRPNMGPRQNPPGNFRSPPDRNANPPRRDERIREHRRPERTTPPANRPPNDPNLHRPHPSQPGNSSTTTTRPGSAQPQPQLRAAPRKDIGTHPEAPSRSGPPHTPPPNNEPTPQETKHERRN